MLYSPLGLANMHLGKFGRTDNNSVVLVPKPGKYD